MQYYDLICWSWFCSLSIILTSYVSRGRANQKAIERLKDMLIMVSHMWSNTYILTHWSQKEDTELLSGLLVCCAFVSVCMLCMYIIYLCVFPSQSSSDKRFLVKQHATMLRRQRNPCRVRPAAMEEDAPLNHWKDPTSMHTSWLKSPSCQA